ncbi:hypothetical protein IAR55_001381 [Kwoniella newhampshirensis]|uniref:NAD-dependent epimerase/dehydratase domain-containing protein n=1 Tax=Kwoniella newhampshirensis TaxID=1651941 RepID=A0AAW0Z248_9TREE
MTTQAITKPLTIAVTGSAGLVGSHLCAYLLSQGLTVIAIDVVPIENHLHHALESKFHPTETERYTYKVVRTEKYEEYRDACRGAEGLVHLAAIYHTEKNPKTQWEIHNANVAMSYNTLCIAAELEINRVVLASSVNAIGMIYCKRPTFYYLPLDEKHPCRPEDAYSLCKYMCELQADSFVRTHPALRVATLRFHGVVPPSLCTRASLLGTFDGANPKDFWGWVSSSAVSSACLKALIAPTDMFPEGSHETFFIVARTICKPKSRTEDLVKDTYPELKAEVEKLGLRGNEGLFDTSKAEKMLDWKDEGHYWEPGMDDEELDNNRKSDLTV